MISSLLVNNLLGCLKSLDRSSVKVIRNQPYYISPSGEKIFGDKIRNVHVVTGSNWIIRKGTPAPQMTHKPADFMPDDTTPPGTSATN